jgi:hypothetical protein
MGKIGCVVYDEPVDGYPKTFGSFEKVQSFLRHKGVSP